jgi:hypothetical protein
MPSSDGIEGAKPEFPAIASPMLPVAWLPRFMLVLVADYIASQKGRPAFVWSVAAARGAGALKLEGCS